MNKMKDDEPTELTRQQFLDGYGKVIKDRKKLEAAWDAIQDQNCILCQGQKMYLGAYHPKERPDKVLFYSLCGQHTPPLSDDVMDAVEEMIWNHPALNVAMN